MASLLYRLGRFAFRRRWLVLAIWLLVALALGAVALIGGAKLENQYTIPGTESQRGIDMLTERFPQAAGTSSELVFEVPQGAQVTDAPYHQQIQSIADAAAKVTGVEAVSPIFGEEAKDAVSDNGRFAQTTIMMDSGLGEDSTTMDELAKVAVAPAGSDLVVSLGGQSTFAFALSYTEVLGVGFAFLVMAVTFGSLLMAGMPLLTAFVGIGVSVIGILAISVFTPVATMAPTLAMMIGLAVGIDYALFIGTRYRHELVGGASTQEAAGRAIATAGSAVVFAGATVTIALCALSVVGIPILTVIGLSAGATVVLAVCVALTILPALFSLCGERLRPGPTSRAYKRESAAPDETRTFGSKWVRLVTKIPALTVLAVVVLGVVLALPAKDLQLSMPDNGTAPKGSTARVTYDMLAEGFGAGYNAPLLVAFDIVGNTDPLNTVNEMADTIGDMPGVAAITLATPNASVDTGLIRVIPQEGQTSQATKDLVAQIRSAAPGLEERFGVQDLVVTGTTAVIIDVSAELGSAMLPFGLVVVGLSLILLMVVFRSIAVPIKAALGYVLSCLVAFGAVVAVFEWGWAADLLNVPKVGPVVSFLPIILMGVLFGLAMDYEVFLVSRMHEEFQHTGRARRAIYTGFTSSSRVVTAAALIMLSVFVGFIPHGDAFVQPIAFGLGVGVLFDAFFVRMTLVPAVMALLGKAAWWLPAWLERVLPSLDVEGKVLEQRLAYRRWEADNGQAMVRAQSLVVSGVPDAVPQDVVVRPGTVNAIVGANDVARATLLLTLAGRSRPVSGQAVVGGDVLPDQAAAVRRTTALIPAPTESPYAALTVGDYLRDNLTVRAWWPWQRRRATLRVLAAATELAPGPDAAPQADTRLVDLNILQRRLLDLGVAATSSAQLLILDGVDAMRIDSDREALWDALDHLAAKGRTILAGVRRAPARPVTVIAMRERPYPDLAAAAPGSAQSAWEVEES